VRLLAMGILSSSIEAELRRIVGEDDFSASPLVLVSYSRDASPFPAKEVAAVVRPTSTEQVSEILRLANRRRVPIVPVGSRSGICGAALPRVYSWT